MKLNRLTQEYMSKGFDIVTAREKAVARVQFEKEIEEINTSERPSRTFI